MRAIPKPKLPSWLPELTKQVNQELALLCADRKEQIPAQELELGQIEENIKGWSASLAKPTLAPAVRASIEEKWAAAIERQQSIRAELGELAHATAQFDSLVHPDEVLDRLNRLADVLAANNPTRGNIELSLHIDRIVCDGKKVTLRTCKLGLLPEAIQLMTSTAMKQFCSEAENHNNGRARRRGKLRVDESNSEMDALVNFVADTNRFAKLGENWFWLDEFEIPEPTSWASDNAEAVFGRRQATRFSYAKLAKEFGVTPPTIGAAIRKYIEKHPGERDDVQLPRGGKRPPKFDLSQFAAEAKQLWLDGESKESLARRYGCSSPTITKAIAFAYAQEGSSMPQAAEVRGTKIAEARRQFDAGHSLDAIAAAMRISDVTARRLLQESFAAEGKSMPDLRRRVGL